MGTVAMTTQTPAFRCYCLCDALVQQRYGAVIIDDFFNKDSLLLTTHDVELRHQRARKLRPAYRTPLLAIAWRLTSIEVSNSVPQTSQAQK